MLKRYSRTILASTGLTIVLAAAPAMADPDFAVWLDGDTTPGGGGNGIVSSLDRAFGAGDYVLVTTADLETPGFLNAYKAVIVSRYDSSFGTSLSSAAAANISSYVGSGASQGGVAVFTNDAADDFYGATTGDPYVPDLDQLFVNAATYAAASGHGFIGEYNGAVMAFDSNSAGYASIGLLQGNASATYEYEGGTFVYGVGPIGAGNPIDAGVSFPLDDTETSTFLTDVAGYDPNNVVDIYTTQGSINGEPAILANHFVISGGGGSGPTVPEPSTWAMMLLGFVGLGIAGRRVSRRRMGAISLA
jgi:hypothetical protein